MKNKSKKARSYSSDLLKGLMENRNEFETNRTQNRMLIAARIDDLLKENKWKKKDLAKKLGKKHASIITKWLSGTHNFTTDTLSDLEIVFGEKFLVEKSTKEIRMVYSKRSNLKPIKGIPDTTRINEYSEMIRRKGSLMSFC